MEASSSELGVNEISKVIKILGVNFSFNHSLFYKLNFESIENSVRGLLKGWSWRGLTLLGKIQVIKGAYHLHETIRMKISLLMVSEFPSGKNGRKGS